MSPSVESFLDDPAVCRAVAHARDTDEQTLDDQLELTAIAAPPFGERARAEAMGNRLRRCGLPDTHLDEVGNVIALRPGSEKGVAPVILSAHLDTVFSEETPIEVRREGDLLAGPGISDDGRGLAVVLAVARALEAGGVNTNCPILFVGTVGEEGLGDLRGAKHLMSPAGAGSGAAAFISVDGAGLDRIVTRGLGSRRFRLSVRGPGGHSWQNRGTSNPIHALGRVVESLAELVEPHDTSSALTVARWGGGTSINSIPQEAWIEVDCRSVDEGRLESIEIGLRHVAAAAVSVEAAGCQGTLQLSVESVGIRPSGATDPHAPVVRAARRATEAVGAEPVFVLASTDANAAMARGVSALTMGGGGEAGQAHTTAEWYRNVGGPEGVLRALYTVTLTAGLAG